MLWLNVSLALVILALVLTVALSGRSSAWPRARPLVLVALQLGGVLLVTWWLVNEGRAAIPSATFTPVAPPDLRVELQTALGDAWRSLWLVLAAASWGAVAGLAGAIALKRRPVGRGHGFDAIAALLWVVPTFLFAVFVQELQAQVFNLTGSAVGGGYGTTDLPQVIWSALVLGIRPAAYVFRSARRILDEEEGKFHVRAGRARGLPDRTIAVRYVAHPGAAALLSGWLNSLRLMIGSLPLIEFLFGYPGLGQGLMLALGISYGFSGQQAAKPDPDLAILLVALLACLMIGADLLISFLQQVLDPRVREVRVAA